MYALLLYALKAGACLAAFYLFFKLLLSRETFHHLNRILVLGAVVLSFVLPLCVITIYREMPFMPEVRVAGEELAAAPVRSGGFAWQTLAGWLFVAGAGATLLRTIGSLGGVLRLIRRGRRERLEDGSVLVRTAEAVLPFSWGRYIVISDEDMARNGREILLHERAHVRLHHSADLLLIDLAGCLQWFNPAMWLLRRELREIHEYEADRAVLRSGVDARAYQLLLIRKTVGARRFSVANSFNQSKLKNRITMMLRKKSSRWAGAKTLLVLPLAGLALGAFARTAYVFPEIEPVVSDSLALSKPGISIRGAAGEPLIIVDGRVTASVEALDSLDADRFASVSVLRDSTAVQLYGRKAQNGVIIVTTKPELRVRTVDTLAWSSAKNEVKSGDTMQRATVRVRPVGSTGKKPVYLVDGERVSDVEGLEPQQIESVSVLTNESVPEVYRLEGYDGLVSVTTKKGAKTAIPAQFRDLQASASAGLKARNARDAARIADAGIESAQKGIESARTALETAREQIPPKEWRKAQRELDKAQEQLEKTREQIAAERNRGAGAAQSRNRIVWGGEGVATGLGTTIVERDEKRALTIYRGTVTLLEAPDAGLIFINGKRATKADVERIAPKKIRSIAVYSGEEAVRKFGEEGRDGVIVIRARK